MWKDIFQDINSCLSLGNKMMGAFFHTEFLKCKCNSKCSITTEIVKKPELLLQKNQTNWPIFSQKAEEMD